MDLTYSYMFMEILNKSVDRETNENLISISNSEIWNITAMKWNKFIYDAYMHKNKSRWLPQFILRMESPSENLLNSNECYEYFISLYNKYGSKKSQKPFYSVAEEILEKIYTQRREILELKYGKILHNMNDVPKLLKILKNTFSGLPQIANTSIYLGITSVNELEHLILTGSVSMDDLLAYMWELLVKIRLSDKDDQEKVAKLDEAARKLKNIDIIKG